MTIDVVTPMVDDPEAFGAIAATNALSDVYAMGGVPKVALSFIGFPTDQLDLEVLSAIIAGVQKTCAAAGCAIVGGHTIIDPEPKVGLSVTGEVERKRLWSHRSAQAGQHIVLTKPIGTGVIVQAMKGEKAPREAMEAAIASMRLLNDRARDAGMAAGVTSATDVTGFGLLGHLRNMCEASNVRARVDFAKVPLLPHAEELARQGIVPGGSKKNLRFVEPSVDFGGLDDVQRLLLADAQTSGGLLLCAPPAEAEALVVRLGAEGMIAAVIGGLADPEDGAPVITVGEFLG